MIALPITHGAVRAPVLLALGSTPGPGHNMPGPRVKMHHGAARRFVVIDYAWADPGESLAAGQTSSSGDQVSALPDLDSLGTLAFGANGVVAWRQNRAKADSAPALPMNPNRQERKSFV